MTLPHSVQEKHIWIKIWLTHLINEIQEHEIGHFRAQLSLHFKASLSAKSCQYQFSFIPKLKLITTTTILHLVSLWKRDWENWETVYWYLDENKNYVNLNQSSRMMSWKSLLNCNTLGMGKAGVSAASDSRHQKNENKFTKRKTYCSLIRFINLTPYRYQLGPKHIKLGTLWSISRGHLNRAVTRNSVMSCRLEKFRFPTCASTRLHLVNTNLSDRHGTENVEENKRAICEISPHQVTMR